MELSQFLIWLLIIWLVSFLLSLIILKSINFKQSGTKTRVLQLSLILSLFIALIFGLILKPYIAYNNCQNYKYILGSPPFTYNINILNCSQALWLTLLFSYLAGYAILYLILLNMHIEV